MRRRMIRRVMRFGSPATLVFAALSAVAPATANAAVTADAAAAVVVTAPAHAPPVAGQSHAGVLARACSGDFWRSKHGSKDLDTIDYMYAYWTCDQHGQYIQTRGFCKNFVTTNTHTEYSTATRDVGRHANVQCGVLEVMLVGDVRFTNRSDGKWGSWHQVCAPCGANESPSDGHRLTKQRRDIRARRLRPGLQPA
jgi:hypothetical protein